MSRCDDIIGKKFGKLTVMSRAEDYVAPSGRHYVRFNCMCDCGNEICTNSDAIRRGKTTSCGCLRKEITSKRQKTHGESKSKLYGVWCSMRSRCENQNDKHYAEYGGRNVSVCQEWNQSFESFRSWAYQNGYEEGLTIDRIDNNSDYSPFNCRWVDMKVQANNRRSNRQIYFNGETHTIKEWSEIIGIPYKTLHNRIYSGWDVETALTYNIN